MRRAQMRLKTTLSFGENSFETMHIPFIAFPEAGKWYIWTLDGAEAQAFLIRHLPDFAEVDLQGLKQTMTGGLS